MVDVDVKLLSRGRKGSKYGDKGVIFEECQIRFGRHVTEVNILEKCKEI